MIQIIYHIYYPYLANVIMLSLPTKCLTSSTDPFSASSALNMHPSNSIGVLPTRCH